VILNLMVNADEAIRAIEGTPREILIATRQPEPGRLVITVRDSGIGVNETELERIFERFVTSQAAGAWDGVGESADRSSRRTGPHLGDRQHPTGASRCTSSCRRNHGKAAAEFLNDGRKEAQKAQNSLDLLCLLRIFAAIIPPRTQRATSLQLIA
jgi:hypothetical protein